MKAFAVVILFTFALTAHATPPFDPNGAKNVGNGRGEQFITGQCLSNSDCASNCCAGPTGICSGPGAADQAGKTGCGFGSTSEPSSLVVTPVTPTPASVACGDANSGNSSQICGNSTQTGGNSTQTGGNSTQTGGNSTQTGSNSTQTGSNSTDPATGTNQHGGPPFDPNGEKNVGNGQGEQFITGQCLGNSDCASGCCAGPSGICSGPGAATQAGKTGCNFVSKMKRLKI